MHLDWKYIAFALALVIVSRWWRSIVELGKLPYRYVCQEPGCIFKASASHKHIIEIAEENHTRYHIEKRGL